MKPEREGLGASHNLIRPLAPLTSGLAHLGPPYHPDSTHVRRELFLGSMVGVRPLEQKYLNSIWGKSIAVSRRSDSSIKKA